MSDGRHCHDVDTVYQLPMSEIDKVTSRDDAAAEAIGAHLVKDVSVAVQILEKTQTKQLFYFILKQATCSFGVLVP